MKSDLKIDGDRLQLTRTFAAPRERVFAWWTSAEKMQQWSSCKEATACEITMDFRVGGKFTNTMEIHGSKHTMVGTFQEIRVPEKIVYTADLGPMVGTIPTVTIEFFDLGQSTKVVLTHVGLPNEFIQKNVAQGTDESFDKLDVFIASQSSVTQPA